jgi:hypothetical protein
MLPSNAVCLIHEYSKPVTRPDWRQSKPIVTTYQLYKIVVETQLKLSPLMYRLFMNIYQTWWFGLFVCIRFHGLKFVFHRYDITHENLMKIDGVQDALDFYKNN